MNGASRLINTLVEAGVEVCFANPGTSEMHLVQAIDASADMRGVLCLFEGVCTGAADGYGRMREAPACTLLHLGAGLGNGIANLHNARRADSPIVNLIGDHAIHHVPYDAPLTADIEGIARPVSAWVRTARSASGLAADGRDAVLSALSVRPASAGRIATLIVPADCAWGEGFPVGALAASARPARTPVSAEAVSAAASAIDAHTLMLLDGNALTVQGLTAAHRIAQHTGASVSSTTFPARVESGPGLFPVRRMPYFPEQVGKVLQQYRSLLLVGAERPVSFFAYEGQASDLVPEAMAVRRLASRHEDAAGALENLAAALDAPHVESTVNPRSRPPVPDGPLSTGAVSQILAATMPDDAIVTVDSGGGGAAYSPLQSAARHSWLNLTGGAIGQGGPVAVGAAIACPTRPVFALLGDGGAMYTNQFLWTAAREKLDITVVVFSNRSYNILEVEYRRLGVNRIGASAAELFALDDPPIDWTALATAQGVPAERADECAQFAAALRRAADTEGPYLIEATVTARD